MLEEEKIVKLPAWARAYVRKIERERDSAIQALNDYCDKQNPSAIYYDDLTVTGEESGPTLKRIFIQSHRVEIEHNGVYLQIILREHIDLSWANAKNRSCFVNVAFVPTALQAASLIARDNMHE